VMYGATGAKSRLLHLSVGTIGGEKNRAKPPVRVRIYFAVEAVKEDAIPFLANEVRNVDALEIPYRISNLNAARLILLCR
jgi:hypothetical protein